MKHLVADMIRVWRWDDPSKIFDTVPNTIIKYANVQLKSHSDIVYAGLHPEDWFNVSGRGNGWLHAIDLTQEEAEKCVVTEGMFRPQSDEYEEYAKKEGRKITAVHSLLEALCYEKMFKPISEYKGEYVLPEVLIPFKVKAKRLHLLTIWMRLRRKIMIILGRHKGASYLDKKVSYRDYW